MHTACLPTVRGWVCLGVGIPGPRSRGGTGTHYSPRHTHYLSGHTPSLWTYPPPGHTHLKLGIYPPPEGTCVPHAQTHTCENVTFPQLLLRAVIIGTHQHTRNINTTHRLEECEGMPRETTHSHLHNITIKCGNFLKVLLLFNCNWYPTVCCATYQK